MHDIRFERVIGEVELLTPEKPTILLFSQPSIAFLLITIKWQFGTVIPMLWLSLKICIIKAFAVYVNDFIVRVDKVVFFVFLIPFSFPAVTDRTGRFTLHSVECAPICLQP